MMDFDEEKIGMVLVRASELRSKIANCIRKASASSRSHHNQHPPPPPSSSELIWAHGGGRDDPSSSAAGGPPNDSEEEEDDESAETLLNICDAFESLESQLTSLQALQQQQQYQREAAIVEIEYSSKSLLKKLQEYKGEHLDAIQEAAAFVSMKVEHKNELLLPPYPSYAPHSLILDNSHLSNYLYPRKPTQNGLGIGETVYKATENHEQSEAGQNGSTSSSGWRGLKLLMNTVAKALVTVVSVVTVLSVAGYEPRVGRKDSELKIFGLFQPPRMKEMRISRQCPPGKVAVEEDGEVRCIVKERVEIPFSSVASKPDVNYGCG